MLELIAFLVFLRQMHNKAAVVICAVLLMQGTAPFRVSSLGCFISELVSSCALAVWLTSSLLCSMQAPFGPDTTARLSRAAAEAEREGQVRPHALCSGTQWAQRLCKWSLVIRSTKAFYLSTH